MNKNLFFYETSIGKIGIADNGTAITNLYFSDEDIERKVHIKETALIKKAAAELHEYLRGTRQLFDLPLAPAGTEFQQAVWRALQEIPYGETRCYQEIAEKINRPKACRAVGLANNKNPIAIIIPCHRVIGKNGQLVGYAGGISMKERLLEIERRRVKNREVDDE